MTQNEFISKILDASVFIDKILPIGQLCVFFHAANGLENQWGKTGDAAEKRNYQMYRAIKPHIDPLLIGSVFSGSFKPSKFIHPFEKHYSTPGYIDKKVLPLFFKIADELALAYSEKDNDIKYNFLAFVYMTFLVIHPFLDGNGRVARNLLTYYNKKLAFDLNEVWEDADPKFKENEFHKNAFAKFFCYEAQLASYDFTEVSSLSIKIKIELNKMSDYLANWLSSIKNIDSLSSKSSIVTLADGIKKLQH